MKGTKSLWIIFGLLIVIASLYRVWDGRPLGFAPHIAMAVFGGAVIKDKKWAFLLPLFSMFVSDALYQFLYMQGLSPIPGFYEGQLLNYVLFGTLTFFGFVIRRINVINVLAASLTAPTVYFLLSNFAVWIGGGGYARPKTGDGLMMAYADGLPFYTGSLVATLIFSIILFGSYYLLNRCRLQTKTQLS